MICQNDCIHSKTVPMKAPVSLDHVTSLLFHFCFPRALAMPVICGSCLMRIGCFYFTVCRWQKVCRWDLPTQELCDSFLHGRNSAPQSFLADLTWAIQSLYRETEKHRNCSQHIWWYTAILLGEHTHLKMSKHSNIFVYMCS